jgi:hypothetical protein
LLALATLSGFAAPVVLLAQGPARPWVTISSTALQARSLGPAGTDNSTGTALGGEGGLAWGPLALRLGYTEGVLQSDANRREYVEGVALVGATLFSGFQLWAGPQARACRVDGIDERWASWQLRLRYEGPIIPSGTRHGIAVHGWAEAWGAWSGEETLLDRFDPLRGAAAGILLQAGHLPITAGLSYSLDELALQQGIRREIVEGLTFAVRWGSR